MEFHGISASFTWVKSMLGPKKYHGNASCLFHFIPFHPFSALFIPFHPFSSLFIPFHPFSSLFIPFHPFSSLFIPFHPFSSLFIPFHPFHPFSSLFIPFHPFSSLFILLVFCSVRNSDPLAIKSPINKRCGFTVPAFRPCGKWMEMIYWELSECKAKA